MAAKEKKNAATSRTAYYNREKNVDDNEPLMAMMMSTCRV